MLARLCRRVPPVRGRFLWRRTVATGKSPLKGWQEDAIKAGLNAIQGGLTKIGLHMCGREKSGTLMTLMDRIPPPNTRATKILLVAVSEKRGQKLEGVFSRQKALRGHIAIPASGPDVIVKTYAKIMKSGLKYWDKSLFKAIVLVEAPRARPEFYDILASHSDSEKDVSQVPTTPYFPIIVGSSSDEDVLALHRTHFFEDVVYQRRTLDFMQEKWHCGARFLAAPSPIQLSKLKITSKGSFQKPSALKAMSQGPVVQSTIQAWLDNAATRKSTLVYCVNDAHAEIIVDAFQKANIDARRVSQFSLEAQPSSGPRLAYKEAIAGFAAGTFPVLVATPDMVVDTSQVPDLPGIDCVVIASLTMIQPILEALILPGMKLSPVTLKEDTLVIQVIDTAPKRPGYDICHLLRLHAEEIDGQPLNVLRRRADEKARLELENIKPTERTLPASPQASAQQLPASAVDVSLGRQGREDKYEAQDAEHTLFTKKRWVRCGPGMYVNDWLDHGHALVRESENKGLYQAYWTPRRLDSEDAAAIQPGARKLSVLGSLAEVLAQVIAFRGAGRAVTREYRDTNKATPAQLKALREFCPDTMADIIYEGEPMSRDAFFEWLTVGDASNALARLRYGSGTNVEPFSFDEQTAIVKRIRKNATPWETAARIAAAQAANAVRKITYMKERRELKRLRREGKKAKMELKAKEKGDKMRTG
ncbi:hypothetical protein FB451DRAFT_242005 [Mycena latifolia]|nr:hypothetical protein FB451DRAFT_242005 [Mycena latifolia]